MLIPDADIKNMPLKVKLRLIEKLSKSVDRDIVKTEEDAILEERIQLFEKGKLKFDSWENVKSRLIKKYACKIIV
jgi:Putative addiction module component